MEVTYRIAAERCDILPHPVDAKLLILESQVPFLAVSEAKNVETIVD
jgi:hypothetical protein